MEISNLIALGALIVSFIALIPSYYQAFFPSRKSNSADMTKKPITSDKEGSNTDSNRFVDAKALSDVKADEEPMPIMLRVLVLTVLGVIIGLVELIIFSVIAYFFGVEVNLETMPLVWKIIFFSLIIIPWVLFWLAFVTFTTIFNRKKSGH